MAEGGGGSYNVAWGARAHAAYTRPAPAPQVTYIPPPVILTPEEQAKKDAADKAAHEAAQKAAREAEQKAAAARKQAALEAERQAAAKKERRQDQKDLAKTAAASVGIGTVVGAVVGIALFGFPIPL